MRDEALGTQALRVDAEARAFDHSASLDVSLWLARNADGTPLRSVVE